MSPANAYYKAPGVTLYHADFREWSTTASYAAVITDPPYGKGALGLWEPLGAFSARILEPGGFLQAILPHYAIPQVIADVSRSLKWRWMLAMWQESGSHPRMAMGVEVMWKPIGWWVNGAWPKGRGYKRDGFTCPGAAKGHHRWEQAGTWARYCLGFVPPGGTVIDPMCGSGTLLVEAIAAGYRVTGIDSDEAACETAANRLSRIGQDGALSWERWVKASQTTGIRATRILRRQGGRAASPPSPE